MDIDIPKLGNTEARQIRVIIENKLSASPEIFGKYLTGSLFPCLSLRVGDYRVLYEIVNRKEVFVLLIEHRSVAYKIIYKRI